MSIKNQNFDPNETHTENLAYLSKHTLSEHADIFQQKLLCHLAEIGVDHPPFNEDLRQESSPSIKSNAKFKSRLKKVLANVISNKLYKKTFICMLSLDSLFIGICVNYYEQNNANTVSTPHKCQALFQTAVSALFCLEIIIKLFIDFKSFWQSPWNIFEFILFELTSVCQIMDFILVFKCDLTKRETFLISLLKFIRAFRILRNLKLLSHFVELRIIIICLTRAVRSVVLISLLLLIISFLFAKIGFILFSNMDTGDNAMFGDSFSSIFEALLSLFAIMTLDQWWKIFSHVSQYYNKYFLTTFYFVAWIILASFIFQNLFTGIMVNNFQEIRKDVIKALDIKKIKKKIKFTSEFKSKISVSLSNKSLNRNRHLKKSKSALRLNEIEFKNRLINNLTFMNTHRKPSRKNSKRFEQTHLEKLNKVLDKMREYRSDNQAWTELMRETFDILKNMPVNTIWPEDSLLKYYELMQFVLDNLKERMSLLDFANQSLLAMHDRDNLLFPSEFYRSDTKT